MTQSWQDEYLTMIEDCEKREGRLTEWQATFIDSLRRRIEADIGPTPKQIEVLESVWEKATKNG